MSKEFENDTEDKIYSKSMISNVIYVNGVIIKNLYGEVQLYNYRLYDNLYNLEINSFDYENKTLYLVTKE